MTHIFHAWHLRISPAAAAKHEADLLAKARTRCEEAVRMPHTIAGDRDVMMLREEWALREIEDAKAALKRLR